jgi:hypothetical protein
LILYRPFRKAKLCHAADRDVEMQGVGRSERHGGD